MLTIGYSTKKINPEFRDHIEKSCGIHKVEVIPFENPGTHSLSEAYNIILEKASNDIVVLCHDDITFEKKNWGNKILKHFNRNPDYGILGVAGSKYLPDSGQWWEKRKKMYGRVQHTSEGKTWLSAYSPDIGSALEEVLIVDGVFFSVHKGRIKKRFDETVKGFHFYDVDFCFQNYLEGVKVGVHTNIKVNHQSIGQTNEDWDDNRKLFVEKYSSHLPVNIKRTFRKGQKIKVLIGCLNFANHTGSELYVYELTKELLKQGCEVSVCSTIGDPLARMVTQMGGKVYSIQEPPGFKLGDGKWSLNTTDGLVLSIKNQLYKTGEPQFDVLHLNHTPITEHLLKLYPDIDTICSIHSEVIDLEHPVIHPQIKKYIAIRPEIKDYLINRFNIDADMIDVIYNPIDHNRFKLTHSNNKRPVVLFVGTMDYLREETIKDLIETTKVDNKDLWLVGKENGINIEDLIGVDNGHVTYHGPTWKVEEFVKKCDETAGILLGRTTIEGWLCGKAGWIYDVNSSGQINGKELHQVPYDVAKFRADIVATEIIEKYKEIIE
tara:strand:- start:9588 stop:11234 length:1647 start_codon:yes stop_codon:yes gene_type:complete